ncbi:uncharacterized protein yc1106_08089 [Curvularia clavata]|uniref:S-adenosyl-L-methionine-dependent methyltransferase n=1 Tax=Curvularia clavata TaxID=95742 RepID=A0A9Q9DWB8_CURCL|nr:uncharacterized protein yc1106_08089 [Curvularia clavata]
MPRISTSLIRKARTLDALLPVLLAPCRNLQAAQNELRWLREHVEEVAKKRHAQQDKLVKGALLRQLVQERARGKPLQYILGTEYFGNLEIRCKPGVLIPRPDTAASVAHLVRLLRDSQHLPPELRLLDLCTGTGCIPLLFQHEFLSARKDVELRLLGVDICDKALALATQNLQRLSKDRQLMIKGKTNFMKADVLMDPFVDAFRKVLPFKTALNHAHQPNYWDILISNPPYISPSAFWKTTTRSVRNFEPKLALVPPSKAKHTDTQQGDMFYPRLLDIAQDVEAKVVLLEVADVDQAVRVANTARDMDMFDGVEIWREDPNARSTTMTQDGFEIIGEGNARTVLCWRGQGAHWLGKVTTTKGIAEDAKGLSRSRPTTSMEFAKPSPPKTDIDHLRPQFDMNIFSQQNNETCSRLPSDKKESDQSKGSDPES